MSWGALTHFPCKLRLKIFSPSCGVQEQPLHPWLRLCLHRWYIGQWQGSNRRGKYSDTNKLSADVWSELCLLSQFIDNCSMFSVKNCKRHFVLRGSRLKMFCLYCNANGHLKPTSDKLYMYTWDVLNDVSFFNRLKSERVLS